MNQHPWIQCKSDRGFLPHRIGIRPCATKPLLEDDIWWNSKPSAHEDRMRMD